MTKALLVLKVMLVMLVMLEQQEMKVTKDLTVTKEKQPIKDLPVMTVSAGVRRGSQGVMLVTCTS